MSLDALITTCLGVRDPIALAKEQSADWASWLLPVGAASAVGDDPGYDDNFQRIREEVNRLSAADVDEVIRVAETLLKQTCKDVRVVTYYLWARLCRDGQAGLGDGLNLQAALIERYGATLLPARANSRKLAMEWLASSKVLDSLSRHPDGTRAEIERTVASLAWVEQGLNGLPVDQRPDLGPLHAALATRVAKVYTPQTAESSRAAGAVGTPQHTAPTHTVIRSARDVLDSGKALANYVREQPQGWLAAHRLMKSLRWDTIHQPPPVDVAGHTRLAPPRSEYRAQLKRLHLQQSWDELLDQVDRMFAEGVNHFWLDLQWFLHEALNRQSTPNQRWADTVKQDLLLFIERVPGLETLCWSDGTPFADETTQGWIAQLIGAGRELSASTRHSACSLTEPDMLSLETEAFARVAHDGVEAALGWLAERPDLRSGRQRWLSRLLMARVAEQAGRSELALHLLSELELAARRHGLGEWEPDLQVEVTVRLLTVLRLKAQRSAADKPQLNQRMEPLLATLAAMDPVRAVHFCG